MKDCNLHKNTIIECERFLHHEKNIDNEIKGSLYLKLASAYKSLNNDIAFMINLKKAYNLLKTSNNLEKYYYELVSFLLARKKTDLSLNYINKIQNKFMKKGFTFLYYLISNNWKDLSKQIQKEYDIKVYLEVIKNIQKIKKIKSKKKTLIVLTNIIPGVTYLNAKDYKKGIEFISLNYLLVDGVLQNTSLVSFALSAFSYYQYYKKKRKRVLSEIEDNVNQKALKLKNKIFNLIQRRN